ncbi:MAG: tetratricopeptide repeat protein [Agarilytica sp.]
MIYRINNSTSYTGKLLRTLGLSSAVCVLISCANSPQQDAPTNKVSKQAATTNADDALPPRVVTVPDREFSADTLYALLVAEMAIDRKRYDIALGNYVQQASSTQDLLVTARATRIARSLNARQSALEMSQLWLDIDPESPEARYLASSELISANHLFEAFELSRKMLLENEPTNFESIAMRAEKGDIEAVKALTEKYAELLKTHKEDAGLWLGQSVLLQQAGDLESALNAASQAKKLDENPIRSAFQETRVLYKMGKEKLARDRLAKLVKNNPNNVGLRARYARLVWTTSPELARDQFEILHKQQPSDGEILYSLALVEKDLGELSTAQTHFELLMADKQYRSEAHYNLGEIHQARNELKMALRHFRAVGQGKNYVNALIKSTEVMQAMGKHDEAIAFVKEEQAAAQDTTAEALFMLEADLYSKAGQMNAAEGALSKGVDAFPTSTRLLYARAMLYSQIDYISAAEKDLKAVLALVPENAAALNALGYTLADRTNRYQEAYEYIKQAYALTPDDPAVIDSMGWIAYRLGNYEEALEKLRQAMTSLPDHEIAAHLGEVLWVTGNIEEAKSVWKQGLQLAPKSKVIHKTLNRLNASID